MKQLTIRDRGRHFSSEKGKNFPLNEKYFMGNKIRAAPIRTKCSKNRIVNAD